MSEQDLKATPMAEIQKPATTGQDQHIDVAEHVCVRIARMMLKNEDMVSLLESHLIDKHGKPLTEFKGLELHIHMVQ